MLLTSNSYFKSYHWRYRSDKRDVIVSASTFAACVSVLSYILSTKELQLSIERDWPSVIVLFTMRFVFQGQLHTAD